MLPGTDGALALALMHELIVHDWLDHDYIARHIDGWRALRERALDMDAATAPPRSAASPPARSRRSRATMARTRQAAIRLNYGMQRVRGGGNAVRAIACCPA